MLFQLKRIVQLKRAPGSRFNQTLVLALISVLSLQIITNGLKLKPDQIASWLDALVYRGRMVLRWFSVGSIE